MVSSLGEVMTGQRSHRCLSRLARDRASFDDALADAHALGTPWAKRSTRWSPTIAMPRSSTRSSTTATSGVSDLSIASKAHVLEVGTVFSSAVRSIAIDQTELLNRTAQRRADAATIALIRLLIAGTTAILLTVLAVGVDRETRTRRTCSGWPNWPSGSPPAISTATNSCRWEPEKSASSPTPSTRRPGTCITSNGRPPRSPPAGSTAPDAGTCRARPSRRRPAHLDRTLDGGVA